MSDLEDKEEVGEEPFAFSFDVEKKKTLASIDGVPVEGCNNRGKKIKCELANGQEVTIPTEALEEAIRASER